MMTFPSRHAHLVRTSVANAPGCSLASSLVALAFGLGTSAAIAQDTSRTTTLPAVTVTDGVTESATGPVLGYVAKRSATATKTDTPLSETPQAVSVITADRMRDQGAQTIQDALRYTAGVRGETYGLDSRGDWSTVRGTDPVVFQDGMQQTFGYYASARPDPFTLERIEVLKGPASVLYGQGSVGGIINLVTKRPVDTRHGEIQLQAGNYDRAQLAADLTGPLNQDKTLLYRLVAIGRDSGTQVDKVDDDRYVLMPSLTWRPDAQLEWTLLANLQKDETGSTTQFLPHAGTVLPAPAGLPRIPVDVFMSEPGFDEYDTEQRALTSLLTYRPNDVWTLRQNLRYADSEVSYQTIYPRFRPQLQPNGDIDRVFWVAKPDLKYWTVDHQAQATLDQGRLKQTLLAGIDFQHAVTNRRWAYGAAGTLNLYNPVYGNFTPPAASAFVDDPENTIRQTGFYVQDQLTWDERWIVVLGLRHDRAENETDGNPTQRDDANTKRLALMYKADNGLSPYLSYAESFEPTIGLNGDGKAFKPLRGEQYELGLKYEPAGGFGLINAAIYDLREENRKAPDPNNPLNQLQTGEARTRGLELEAVLHVARNWDLIATYSYTDSEVLKGTNAGKNLPSVPEHMASLWSQHRFSIGEMTGFRGGFGVRYIGTSWDGTDTLATPSQTLVDAMVGYDVGAWSFALNVNNLTDETYYTTCLARGDCFVGNLRTVVGTVSYRF